MTSIAFVNCNSTVSVLDLCILYLWLKLLGLAGKADQNKLLFLQKRSFHLIHESTDNTVFYLSLVLSFMLK